MTTSGDLPVQQPDDNEPFEQLLADALSLVDTTAALITDTEVDEHLRSVLSHAEDGDQRTGPGLLETESELLQALLARKTPPTPAAELHNRFPTPRLTRGYGDRLLTPGEVSALFHVDPKTVLRWAASGHLKSIRTPGGHRRFRESEVRRLLLRKREAADIPHQA